LGAEAKRTISKARQPLKALTYLETCINIFSDSAISVRLTVENSVCTDTFFAHTGAIIVRFFYQIEFHSKMLRGQGAVKMMPNGGQRGKVHGYAAGLLRIPWFSRIGAETLVEI
jgi:hypothetical protein